MGMNVGTKVTNIELKNAELYFEAPWESNWAADLQPARKTKPGVKNTADETIRINRRLANLHKDQLVSDVEELVALYAPDAIIDKSSLVKSQASAKRKITTDENTGGVPEGVGDYLRIRITVKNDDPAKAVHQIEALREQLIYDPRVTSYKDQFRVPCPEGGHRKFVANRTYGKGDEKIKAEIQICHEGMETGPHDEAIKALRNCERELAPLVKTMQATKLSNHWGRGIKDMYYFVQEQRRAVNNEQATNCGLNVLLNPEIKHRHAFDAAASRGTNFKAHMATGFHAVERSMGYAASKLPEGSAARAFMEEIINTHGSTAAQSREYN